MYMNIEYLFQVIVRFSSFFSCGLTSESGKRLARMLEENTTLEDLL